MKGEYVDETQHNTHISSRLHQINKFHHNNTNLTGDGATIEVNRRPRGRPPGSRNKPKPHPPPPLLISPHSDHSSMTPYILQLHSGADILDSITQFCRIRNTGLSVITGSGAVSDVTLNQSSTAPSATVTFHGRFDILSISSTILSTVSHPFTTGLAISLAGPNGQIVGGKVVGPLRAAGTVYIIAASFNNPSFERLPLEEESESDVRSASGVSGGGESGVPVESCGVSLYSSHLGSDVIWAPIARQPLMHPPY